MMMVSAMMARISAVIAFAALLPSAALVSAAEPNERTAQEKEDSCWKARYGKCDAVERSADVVFVFPRARFKRNPAQVIKKIQIAWVLLRDLTGIDPRTKFHQRVVVGFRHPSDEGGKDCVPGFLVEGGGSFGFPRESWPCINLPWGYLKSSQQPEEALSHELVHVFINAKPLRDSRKEWVEGMCDFLRLPVLDAVGMRSTAETRYRLFLSSAWKPKANFYHDYAGRLIRFCQRQKVNVRDPEQLKGLLPELWDMDLTAALGRPLTKSSSGAP